MNDVMKELIRVAVALAMSCESCLEKHMPLAKELGATEQEVQEVLNIVRNMKLTTTMAVDELAISLSRKSPTELNMVETTGSSCGCGSGKC